MCQIVWLLDELRIFSSASGLQQASAGVVDPASRCHPVWSTRGVGRTTPSIAGGQQREAHPKATQRAALSRVVVARKLGTSTSTGHLRVMSHVRMYFGVQEDTKTRLLDYLEYWFLFFFFDGVMHMGSARVSEAG